MFKLEIDSLRSGRPPAKCQAAALMLMPAAAKTNERSLSVNVSSHHRGYPRYVGIECGSREATAEKQTLVKDDIDTKQSDTSENKIETSKDALKLAKTSCV